MYVHTYINTYRNIYIHTCICFYIYMFSYGMHTSQEAICLSNLSIQKKKRPVCVGPIFHLEVAWEAHPLPWLVILAPACMVCTWEGQACMACIVQACMTCSSRSGDLSDIVVWDLHCASVLGCLQDSSNDGRIWWWISSSCTTTDLPCCCWPWQWGSLNHACCW